MSLSYFNITKESNFSRVFLHTREIKLTAVCKLPITRHDGWIPNDVRPQTPSGPEGSSGSGSRAGVWCIQLSQLILNRVTAMTYQPLARRYRPQDFMQLTGQRTAQLALRSALRLHKVAAAIIFTGIRGTGKTTLARILAKALNCEQPSEGNPCLKCNSCAAVTGGCHEDVIEIDGASHTSVDDIRVLQESLACKPQRSSHKVYIIDEVHMLSQSAFNALLKTLEEPRPHVVFIFATTEIGKVPATIRSRCQTFHLQKLAATDILARLKEILDCEKIVWQEDALKLLVSYAEGSLRDALTMLDQVILLGEGEVNLAALQHITSHLAPRRLLDLLAALVDKNGTKVLEALTVISDSGIDFKKITEELATYTRHAFIVKDIGVETTEFRNLSLADEIVRGLQDIAAASGEFDLNRIFRTLIKCRQELDGSLLDRYVFENYCLEWCFDTGLPTRFAREAVLPLSSSANMPPPPATTDAATTTPAIPTPNHVDTTRAKATTTPVSTASPAVKPSPPLPAQQVRSQRSAFPATWQELVEAWKKASPFQARMLEEAKVVAYSAECIELAIDENCFGARALLKNEGQQKLEAKLHELFAFRGQLVVAKLNKNHAPNQSLLDKKKELQDKQQQQLLHDAENAPLTVGLQEKLGAKIIDVRFED